MKLYQKNLLNVGSKDNLFSRYMRKAWRLMYTNHIHKWRPANLGRQRNKPRANRTGKEKYL